MKKLSHFFNDFQHIKLDFIIMLFMAFMMRSGQFMLLPFLAIYLTKMSHASAAVIGIAVGIGPFVYGFSNLYAGMVVDRLGVKKVMIGALFICGLSFISFFHQQTIIWCIAMNSLAGIARGFFDIASKAYGVKGLSFEQRRVSFSLRFMAVNCAAALGPIVGAYYAASNSLIIFKIVGVFYTLLGVAAIFLRDNSVTTNDAPVKYSVLTILRNDQALQFLLLASILFMMVFSQIDSTLPQYLYANLSHGVKIYSILLIVNAALCVMTQLIVTKFTANFKEYHVISAGFLLFGMSYIVFGMFLQDSALIAAIILMTLAEIIIMPFNDSLIARIAPPNRIGTYYGISGLSMLGLGVGPMIGGLVYQYCGAQTLFIGCGLVAFLTINIYKKLLNQPQWSQISVPDINH